MMMIVIVIIALVAVVMLTGIGRDIRRAALRSGRKSVYISGRITGLERREYLRRFREAEQRVNQTEEYYAVNPTSFLVCRWPWLYWLVGYRLTLAYDLWRLMHCDRILLTDGWSASRGALIESEVARVMGIERITL